MVAEIVLKKLAVAARDTRPMHFARFSVSKSFSSRPSVLGNASSTPDEKITDNIAGPTVLGSSNIILRREYCGGGLFSVELYRYSSK